MATLFELVEILSSVPGNYKVLIKIGDIPIEVEGVSVDFDAETVTFTC